MSKGAKTVKPGGGKGKKLWSFLTGPSKNVAGGAAEGLMKGNLWKNKGKK